ncbi:MAG: glycosyltransferase family 2 protein [Acidimicrobiales bacterium]|nr:glycosyltransferase family 2 protein [Hyphomonadaceae bacterium]RZV35707.1 MAG: glycosyltransferase family 2 protein [Acidimicrobiales bacterium]
MSKRFKCYVIIATKGRPNDVPLIRDNLLSQSVIPDRIVFIGTEKADLGGHDEQNVDPRIEFIISDKIGSSVQRNVGIERVLNIHGADNDFIALYFDDDFRPAFDWIENALIHFQKQGIGGITGTVLEDGIWGPGISEERARTLIQSAPEPGSGQGGDLLYEEYICSLYGCNMAYSGEVTRNVRFDESLPAYAWLEDKDYSRLAMKYGRIAQVTDCQGVHLGTKNGRTPGVKFGYSQISNPVYLLRKGTMYNYETWKLVLRNIAANHVKMLRPEPWVDRKGRTLGNWRAIIDLIRGRISPQRINDF